MRLLVCGSRLWSDEALIEEWLRYLKPDLIIHGGAIGADALAGKVAEKLKIATKVYPVTSADWRKEGRKAGILRNQKMIEDLPDILIAFWNGTSTGTLDMIQRGIAYRHKVPNFRVYVVKGQARPGEISNVYLIGDVR